MGIKDTEIRRTLSSQSLDTSGRDRETDKYRYRGIISERWKGKSKQGEVARAPGGGPGDSDLGESQPLAPTQELTVRQ